MSATLSDLDLLARLVAFDTTSHRSNLELAEFLCDYLERPGVRVERNPSPDGNKTNLVVSVGPEVGPAREGLVLSGHMDVVPAAVGEWHSDPFELTERGDAWAARGSADMKGFLALAANVFRGVRPADLRHPLVLLYTYDEEVGTLGARHFVETWPESASLPRRTIVGEPTSLRVIRRHKGHVKLRLELEGVSAHSGFPHLGRNALEPAARAVLALCELARALQAEPTPGGEHFPEVPFVPLNVGRVQGGVAVNVVPDRCTVELGVRPLPGMDAAALVERVEGVLRAALGSEGWTLTRTGESPALSGDSPGAAELGGALCALAGEGEDPGASFATDAGWLQQLGLECVLFGPGSIQVAHKPDEHVPKADLVRARGVLGELVSRCCGE